MNIKLESTVNGDFKIFLKNHTIKSKPLLLTPDELNTLIKENPGCIIPSVIVTDKPPMKKQGIVRMFGYIFAENDIVITNHKPVDFEIKYSGDGFQLK